MTSPAPKPLILTLMLGAWNWDEIERDGRETWTPDYSYLVERAEAAKLHALFLGDNPEIDLRVHIGPGIKSPLEPITLMAYLAARTEHIGLVASVSTTFQSPYNVARFFASLDHLSRGRIGWNLITSVTGTENFSMTLPPHTERYRRAEEFLEVVKGLWDGWQEGSVVDAGDGLVRYDPQHIHAVRHVGEAYQVAGPLDVPLIPQRRPVVMQAGSSEEGLAFGARHADAVYTSQHHLADAQRFYSEIKRQSGDPENRPLVLTGVRIVAAATDAEARAKVERANANQDLRAKRANIERQFGHVDLSDLGDDDVIPPERLLPPSEAQGRRHFYTTYWRYAVEDRYTIRQLATVDVNWTITGSPASIADQLLERADRGGTDGYIFQHTDRESYRQTFDGVIPELVRRGRFRDEFTHDTLRGNLGLTLGARAGRPQ